MRSARLVFPVRGIDVSAYRGTRVKIAEKVRQILISKFSTHLKIREVGDRLFY